jgi:hypothetical protein
VLALDLWQVVAHARVWTGTDGFYLVDQMQYLSWIRQAAHHLLAANMFVLRPTPADYFQPAVAISGVLVAAGVPPWLSLLLWKPVAVLAAFFAVREFAHRSLTGTWQRRAALALALFFGSFTVIYGSFGVIGDLFPAFLSWGYTFGLLAIAVMVFAMLSYQRARIRVEAGTGWRAALAPAALGALAGLLHPWQGELLILVVIGGELVLRLGDRWSLPAGRRPRLIRGALRGRGWLHGIELPALTVVAAGLPLLYYVILGRADPSWGLARYASKHSFPLLTIVVAVIPLLLPAILAYRERPRSFLPAATRVWPAAALFIYFVSTSNVSATPLHAFEGITIPLSVLAIEGAGRLRFGRGPYRRLIAALAVALATIPATVYMLHSAEPIVAPSTGNANFIDPDERQALRYLAHDRQTGGVLTRFYLGAVVPAETGRRTFVGDCLWSQPECMWRAQLAQQLFDGSLPERMTRELVRQLGAPFVLADCQTPPGTDRVLAPLSRSILRFGCATIYVLSKTDPVMGSLAQSPPDATLRAPGRQQRRVEHG